jgi:uncharacterized membrane protein
MATRIVRAFALLLVGIYAGGVTFALLAPSTFGLPGSAYVPYWQALNHDYGTVMPILLLTGLVVVVAAAVLSRRRPRPVLALTVGAAVLVIAVIALTVTQMEPLNQLVGSWDPNQLPVTWPAVLAEWHTWHWLRTILALAAFGSLLASSVLDTADGHRPVAAQTATTVAA